MNKFLVQKDSKGNTSVLLNDNKLEEDLLGFIIPVHAVKGIKVQELPDDLHFTLEVDADSFECRFGVQKIDHQGVDVFFQERAWKEHWFDKDRMSLYKLLMKAALLSKIECYSDAIISVEQDEEQESYDMHYYEVEYGVIIMADTLEEVVIAVKEFQLKVSDLLATIDGKFDEIAKDFAKTI